MTETLANYCAVGASCSLQRFTNHFCDRNSLPIYVSIRKKGIHLKNSHRLVYVHERRKIAFASCVSEKNHSAYAVPLGKETGLRMLPTARPWNPTCILPSELMACKKYPPSIVFVSKSFVASANGPAPGTGAVIIEGDLLFPQAIISKKNGHSVLLAKTANGSEIVISTKCTGRFSVDFGPDFDLVNMLQTFGRLIKLPMEVCIRGSPTIDGFATIEEVVEEWALCGMMTGILGEEKGKVQFIHKAQIPETLNQTAQKMVPRDPHSRTALQLKADYEKAMSGHGIESAYDVPNLDIYEDVGLTYNPAYDPYGGAAAAAIDFRTEHPPSHEGLRHVPVSTDWRFDAQETSHSERAVTLPLSEAPALSIINTISRKHPQSSQVLREVNTGSTPWDLSHSKVAVPVADTSLKEYRGPLKKPSEADVPGCDTESAGRNVAFLKSLDVIMVQRLLSGMHLSEHRGRFQAEHVDGELLASCDVECLQDLGVTNHIQKLRLAKLIDGTHSASKYLNK